MLSRVHIALYLLAALLSSCAHSTSKEKKSQEITMKLFTLENPPE